MAASSSASGPYPWEQAPAGYSWEQEDPVFQEEDSDEEGIGQEEEVVTPELAAERLVEFLEDCHSSGKLSAKSLCTLAWWGWKAGLPCLEKLAVNPASGSGNFQRHLTKTFGLEDEKCYVVKVPAEIRHECHRGLHSMRCLPPHELLYDAVDAEGLSASIERATLPPSYSSHPIVLDGFRRRLPVLPLSLYIDGVKVGKSNQSVLGVSIQDLLTGRRFLVAALRKTLLCGCGCKGWCTLSGLFRFLEWSLLALKNGCFPEKGHDGKSLTGERAHWGGHGFGFLAAIVQSRADWAEWGHTIGVFPWNHSKSPCFLCKVNREQMFLGIGKKKFDPEPKTFADYNLACHNCEVLVNDIPPESLESLNAALVSDTREDGRRGRVLGKNFFLSGVALRPGDRIEPSEHLEDWDQLLSVRPKSLLFWRRKEETHTKHRCPFISEELGTSLLDVCAIDSMHTVALGLMAQLVLHCCWALLSGNSWGLSFDFNNQEVQHATNMNQLAKLWHQFFKDNRKSTEYVLTDIWNWRVEKLGSKAKPRLYLKAGQTLSFIRFLRAEMQNWQGTYPHKSHYEKAVGLLMDWYTLMEAQDLHIEPDVVKECMQMG